MTFWQFAYRNVIRNRRVYAAFFMASSFSVMVFFLYSMLLFHPSIEGRFLQEIARLGMSIAEMTLFIFTLFFLFYSMRAFLQARSYEFGILLHLGMSRKQLSRLVMIETVLIGIAATGVGIFFGFLFSKFFFMIVREIVRLPSLPLYFSWQPFVLTIAAFVGLFILIAWIAPRFIKKDSLQHLIIEEKQTTVDDFSVTRGLIGLLLLLFSYSAAALTDDLLVIGLVFLLPPLATMGTYLFFTDSLPLILQLMRKSKSIYWRHFNLLSINQGILRLKENARMFFIVTIVSTVAFMSVGILASLTSFASQYREVNPLGMIYKSKADNPYEAAHLALLEEELNEHDIAYTLIGFQQLPQASTETGHPVTIVQANAVNQLLTATQRTPIRLEQGEAIFLPPTQSAYEQLQAKTVITTLIPSGLNIKISGSLPHFVFPANLFPVNTIVLNDRDYQSVLQQVTLEGQEIETIYAFHVDEWQRTEDIGRSITGMVSGAIVNGTEYALTFGFENPGANYSILRMTFSLLLFIGLLLAGVLFLAAGSFVYFKLYTSLEKDKEEFAVLRRLGITDREFKKIVNRQLIPQFFFPWGVALFHSAFAFMSLQVVWKVLAEISIKREIFIVLISFTLLQVIYFYLIRWRYLSHVRGLR